MRPRLAAEGRSMLTQTSPEAREPDFARDAHDRPVSRAEFNALRDHLNGRLEALYAEITALKAQIGAQRQDDRPRADAGLSEQEREELRWRDRSMQPGKYMVDRI